MSRLTQGGLWDTLDQFTCGAYRVPKRFKPADPWIAPGADVPKMRRDAALQAAIDAHVSAGKIKVFAPGKSGISRPTQAARPKPVNPEAEALARMDLERDSAPYLAPSQARWVRGEYS